MPATTRHLSLRRRKRSRSSSGTSDMSGVGTMGASTPSMSVRTATVSRSRFQLLSCFQALSLMVGKDTHPGRTGLIENFSPRLSVTCLAGDEHYSQVIDVSARGTSGDERVSSLKRAVRMVLVEGFGRIHAVLADGGRGLTGHEAP